MATSRSTREPARAVNADLRRKTSRATLAKPLPAGLLIAAALCAIVASAAPAFAAPVSGDGVDVALAIVPSAAFDKAFVDATHRHLDRMLEHALGSNGAVRRVEHPRLADWLVTRSLEELTPDDCLKLGCSDVRKTLLLTLRHTTGAYWISSAEFDSRFGDIGQVRTAAIVQRPMVADNLGRLALRAYTPVGIVVGRKGTSFVIQLDRQSALTSAPEWKRVRAGTIFRLYRETKLSNGEIDQQSRKDQFLVADRVGASDLDARPVLQAPSDPWFQSFASPRTTFLVRGIDPRREPVAVRVVQAESNAMREGCEVYAAFGPPTNVNRAGKRLGLTNSQGEFSFLPESADLCLITVKYDSLEFTQAIVPGVTPTPRTITVADRTPRLELEMKLTQLHTQLGDSVIRMNDLITRRDAASDAGDSARAADLSRQAREAAEVDMFRAELTALENQAQQRKVDLAARFTEFKNDLDRVERQIDPNAGAKAVATARSRELQDEIKQTGQAMDWPRQRAAYEEYCRLNPSDAQTKNSFEKLQADLRTRGTDHVAARATVDGSLSIATGDDLIAGWKPLRTAIEKLISYDDKLWLAKVNPRFDEWQTMANAAALSVSEAIQDPAIANDAARRRQLENQLTTLEGLLIDLRDLPPRVVRVIR